MQSLTIQKVADILNKVAGKPIAVIGDLMLDRYFWGSVSRISPESPVPVVDLEDETSHLGGAANVANNLKALGIEPLLCGIIGEDNSGKLFHDIATENGIVTNGIYRDKNRPTTVKTRIIGNSQHIARLDREVREPAGNGFIDYTINAVSNTENLAGIIFEDYNKGAISKELISKVIDFANKRNVPIFVDPKNENFFEYCRVTLFKPNKKEAQQALGAKFNDRESIIESGKELLKRLSCENVLLTLGKDGMMLFESSGEVLEVPTRARHVADVSGAGDTAIATLSAAWAGGATVREAALIANFAAGAVCELPGIVAITKELLISSMIQNNTPDN